MAVPGGGGQGMGAAIGIVTAQANFAQAEQQINLFVQQTNNTFNTLNNTTSRTSNTFNALTVSARGLATVLGVNFGMGAIRQLIDTAVAVNDLSVAYDRQMVAAVSLAGSQDELNTLMATYEEATGNILSEAHQLADVTKLMSVGFADSSAELEQFAVAIRGISVAMGSTQHSVTQNLILELFSQRGARLDQLGLQYDKIKAKTEELMEADRGLTRQQAYQQAVLEQAISRYGALSHSVEGAATGVEKLRREWNDYMLELGQNTQGTMNVIAGAIAFVIELERKRLEGLKEMHAETERMRREAKGDFSPQFEGGVPSWMTRSATPMPIDETDSSEIVDAKWAWWDEFAAIEARANEQRSEENASYLRARNDAESRYEQDVLQMEEDFAKNRARAEEDHAQAIADVLEDARQREERAARDHAQSIARMQEDSARQVADRQADLDRRLAERRSDSAEKLQDFAEDRDRQIADRREDSQKRLAEMEEDYARDREDAAREHQLSLEDAAARNDARAIFFEQRRFAEESRQAEEAHSDKVEDEKTKLDEAIQNINEAYERRVADEKEALEKSNRQAKEAHELAVADQNAALARRIADANAAYAQQLADAKTADAQRITDMNTHFGERVARENEDHTDRLTRMGEEHKAEMLQREGDHRLRLSQITKHEYEERKRNDEELEKSLAQLGMISEHYALEHEKQADDMNEAFDRFWDHAMSRITEDTGGEPPDTRDPLQDSIDAAYKSIDDYRQQQKTVEFEGTEWWRLQRLIDGLLEDIKGWRQEQRNRDNDVTPAGMAMLTTGKTGSHITSAAGGIANSLAVSFMPGSIVINGVDGKTAEQLATIIDQRILHAVTTAARRL